MAKLCSRPWRHRPPGHRSRDAQPPTDRFTTVLDLGANVDSTAENLLQFAFMGSALVAAVETLRSRASACSTSVKKPSRVGDHQTRAGELLREAAGAGSSTSTATSKAMTSFKGTTDLVVCDGLSAMCC